MVGSTVFYGDFIVVVILEKFIRIFRFFFVKVFYVLKGFLNKVRLWSL